MIKFKNQRKLVKLGSVFALVLVAGVVYAALSGTLTFNGVVNLGGNVELTIIDTDDHQYPNGVEVDVEVAGDGQSADFTVTLNSSDDYATIRFEIENTGTLPAEVTSITAPIVVESTDGDPDAVIVTLTFPDVTDVLDPGDIVLAYIDIVWDDDPLYEEEEGEFTFTIELDYEKAS